MWRRTMWRRTYSTIRPRAKPSWRMLLSGPLAKAIVLTAVFGSFAVETTRIRKETDDLRGAYETRFAILRDVAQKVRDKQHVDVALELRVADAVTRNKYRSATDVELDAQLEEFLQATEDDTMGELMEERNVEKINDAEVEKTQTLDARSVASSKFL